MAGEANRPRVLNATQGWLVGVDPGIPNHGGAGLEGLANRLPGSRLPKHGQLSPSLLPDLYRPILADRGRPWRGHLDGLWSH